jgi:hypothetical protein
MIAPPLTPQLAVAVQDVAAGASRFTRQLIDALLELTDDRDRLRATTADLVPRLPWCAPMWHVVRAAEAGNPAPALRSLRERLEFDVERSVAAAVKLLAERGCAIRAVPGSDLVAAVAKALPEPVGAVTEVGLAGADAISPTAMLNIVGTAEVARSVPTVIVTTSIKLLPEESFQRMDAPGFERVPLSLFDSVVLDGEVLTPAEAGRRAAAVG